jgi:hypothetical protein
LIYKSYQSEFVVEVECEIVIVSVVGISVLEVNPFVGPVIVKVAGEGTIRVRVLWVGTSNVWLWVFLGISLKELVIKVKCKIVIVSIVS